MKGKKDKGVLARFPPKRRKDVKALIRALGLEFCKAEIVEYEQRRSANKTAGSS
jgi:hypothetical protein